MIGCRTRALRWSGTAAVLLLATVAALGGVPVGREPPKVPAEPPSLAELPHWPFGFEVPGLPASRPDRSGVAKAPVLVWIPSDARHIRAILIVANNTDSKIFAEYAAVREVAARREMGIVYLRSGDEPEIQSVLNAAAEKTGIPEFRHAPWIPLGKSSRGKFPIAMEWNHPKRTIAGISYHAETPTWPVADPAKLKGETTLHVNVNGETEWGGTWFRHVRPSLLNYRAEKQWLVHQVVAKDVGHGDYPDAHGSPGWGKPFPDKVTCIRVWDYLAVFIDKAIGLRVPSDKYPTNGPVELKQVDEASGYLIDPFAVEDLFRQPHYPLRSSPAGYLVGEDGEPDVSGFVAIPPAREFTLSEGVPVVTVTAGKSPAKWLVTEYVKFAMMNDPMTDLAGLEKLRPNPGDKVKIDEFEATFKPLDPKSVGINGGISLQGVKKAGQAVTVLGYTVVEVPEPQRWKLRAPFSVAGRLQVVLNGVPVEHKQVIEFQKGRYPMLVVLRLNGPNWNAADPSFEEVTDKEVELAREVSAEKARRAAEQEKLRTQGVKTAAPLVRKATDVPREERKKMFWVADREQAEAWFKLHAVHGQTFEKQRIGK